MILGEVFKTMVAVVRASRHHPKRSDGTSLHFSSHNSREKINPYPLRGRSLSVQKMVCDPKVPQGYNKIFLIYPDAILGKRRKREVEI